jgi:hypothetical protein
MTTRQVVATAVALAVMGSSTPTTLMAGAQQTGALSGTAKNEAKKPFLEYTVQARNVGAGVSGGPIAGAVALDANGNFSLTSLMPSKYVIELLNKKGKVVCTEGPFDLTQPPMAKTDVVVDCNHVPVAWWLLAAAGAAAITAGIVSGGTDSASQ